MKKPIYLDYSATTPVDPRVAEKMCKYLTPDGEFGNPASRSHPFGWHAEELDGHDVDALQKALGAVGTRGDGRPTAIIAHTVKGKGVSFMEDDNNWHYKICDDKALDAAFKELGLS